MSECSEQIFCRICYSDTNPITKKNDLVAPCKCIGSIKYVHSTCLKMWRMKGKAFRDMKKCEQCNGIYNIPGEEPIYSALISITSAFLILIAYVISSVLFKTLIEAFSILIEELNPSEMIQQPKIIQSFDKTYHLSCVMLVVTIYNLFTTPKFFAIINYIFTFWRIIHFDFVMDKVMFLCFTLYFVRQAYYEVYEKVDGLYYYMLNINWEKNDLKKVSN